MKRRIQYGTYVFLCVAILSSLAFAQTPQHRILLEEFSTAQCGFCPDGDIIAQKIVRDHPSVIWVTHHAGFGVDSMTAPESNIIANAFTNFAPGACIDRGAFPPHCSPYDGYISTIRSKWDSLITAHMNDEPYAEILVFSVLDGDYRNLDCTVDVTFTAAPPTGDLRITVFLVSDSIIGTGKGYDQKNYYNTTQGHPMFGLGDPIVGYTHHRVVSAVITDAWGAQGIIPQTPETGRKYTYHFDGNIPDTKAFESIDDWTQLKCVAFVSYYSPSKNQRKVLNAAEEPVHVTADAPEVPAPGMLSLGTYPNPASTTITFTFNGSPNEWGTIALCDITGKTIASVSTRQGRTEYTVPVAHLPRGLYMYRYIGGSALRTGKVLVLPE